MNRRQFLHRSAAFGALTAAEFAPWQSINAFAREVEDFVRGPAVKDHPLRQVSKHVWMIFSPDGFPTPENQGMMCNITFVDTAKGLVVVDSGASVQIGEMAIRQIKKAVQKPVIAIINTHYHGDHWLGNHAFVEAYGNNLPIYAHPGTIKEIQGVQGNMWRTLMEQWTNQATLGTRVVPPNLPLEHGAELKFGDVTLRLHHFGKAHTPFDLCVEVVEDKLTCIGDVAMDRRIANMDDGSYLGTLKAYADAGKERPRTIWLPGHGEPSGAGAAMEPRTVRGHLPPLRTGDQGRPAAGRGQGAGPERPARRQPGQGHQGFRDQYRQVRQPGLPGGRGGRLLRQMIELVHKIRGCLALATGLFIVGGMAQAAGNDLPAAIDLRAEAAQAAQQGGPLVILYSRRDCKYCETVKRDYLKPLATQPRHRDKLLVRQINQDSDQALVDFRGETTTHARFATGEKIKLVPVVAFYGPNGRRLADSIVGARLPDFYPSYLETAIEQSTAALKAKPPAH
jgi:glyoxylase-like metal-dependent hydrolase (beta-lactamase superfamily II)/thioredoxin-related protein